jgi:ribosomal protein L28
MKTKASVTIKNKVHTYTLEKMSSECVRIVCKAANIDQEFLREDVSDVILDLPNLIISEQVYQKSHNEVIRFRVSSTDKKHIEKKAIKKGYSSVSSYIRNLALSES